MTTAVASVTIALVLCSLWRLISPGHQAEGSGLAARLGSRRPVLVPFSAHSSRTPTVGGATADDHQAFMFGVCTMAIRSV